MNDPGQIKGHHAHIYYENEAQRAIAAEIREYVEGNFDVTMGRWRDVPVGPHPKPMFQVAFVPNDLERLVPWLMLNRRGLSVLIHPETGDHVLDHRDFPIWLGEKLDLDISFLKALDSSA